MVILLEQGIRLTIFGAWTVGDCEIEPYKEQRPTDLLWFKVH